jgi:hypothetical protein
MNYREAIQIQIAALQKIYDNAEGLRDVAGDEQEKEAWNFMRKVLPALWQRLQKLDNSLRPSVANYKLKGNYSITENETTI